MMSRFKKGEGYSFGGEHRIGKAMNMTIAGINQSVRIPGVGNFSNPSELPYYAGQYPNTGGNSPKSTRVPRMSTPTPPGVRTMRTGGNTPPSQITNRTNWMDRLQGIFLGGRGRHAR